MRRFNSGDAPELKQYILVATPKSLEYERLSGDAFNRYVSDGRSAMGKPVDGDFAKALEARQPGQLTLLAEMLRDPDAMSVIRGLRLPPAESGLFSSKPSQYVLSSTTVLLLRGKPLTLTLTSGYENKADLEWLRATTLRWIEELRRLNVSR
jgi:hypothetical protein